MDEDEEVTPEEQAAFEGWWANVPDFVKPGYPLDIPPDRMPFVRFVFTECGAAYHCPEAACRRARECLGGAGPPCYRADRKDLQQVLFCWWGMMFLQMTAAEYRHALEAHGNRYAPNTPPPDATGSRKTKARRGRARKR
jgi:hypothetical protein